MAAACTGVLHVAPAWGPCTGVPAWGSHCTPGLRHLLTGVKSPHSPLPPCRLSVCSWVPREHVHHPCLAHPAAVHVSPAQEGFAQADGCGAAAGWARGPHGSTGRAEGHLALPRLCVSEAPPTQCWAALCRPGGAVLVLLLAMGNGCCLLDNDQVRFILGMQGWFNTETQ